MIKLGDTVKVKYGENITLMWLVKDLSLKRFFEKNNITDQGFYTVLGFQPGKGWWTLNNGSLKEMRHYIRKYAID
jgi:hypothetical protein